MSPADESAGVDPTVLQRLIAVADSIRAGGAGTLPDRLRWESECLQLLDRVWPRTEGPGGSEPVPAMIGRFKVIRELGRGGFGIVYHARDPNLGREVALKVPLPGLIAAPEIRRRFLREAQAVSGLDHPNIVPIHDAVTIGPVAYIVSAYCPGPSLAAWLRSQAQPVPPQLAAQLVRAIARGVEHAHQRNILHRDLKPANVMLQPSGDPEAGGLTPRVTDFGLAKLTDGSTIDETRTGLIIGSAPYMAPEQAAADGGKVGLATDVYALGATLYEILVGRPPFLGRSQGETLHLVLATDPVPPQILRREIPRDLQTICLKALRKNPAHRYPTAAAFEADLSRFLDDQPILARPESPIERGWRWSRRHPARATSLAAGFWIVLLVGLGMVWSNAWLRAHNEELEHAVARADRHAAEADHQRQLVADREAVTDRHLHAARLNLAQQAIAAGQNERAQAILADPSVATGPVRHDFAWRYLWNLARRDVAIWGRHENRLRRIVLGPDNATLATGDQAGVVQLWDVASKRLRTICADPTGPVEEIVFAPSGKYLAVVAARSDQPGAALELTLRDVASGQSLGHLNLTGVKGVGQLRFVAAGRTVLGRVVTQDDEPALIGWNLATLGRSGPPISPDFTIIGCRMASLTPDGRAVWAVERGGRLNLRDAASGQVIRRYNPDLPELVTQAFSPDGRWLVGAQATGDILIWDLDGGGEPRIIADLAIPADELIFRPDSAAILIVAGIYQVRLIDRSGKLIQETLPLDGSRQGRLQFGFSPDGRWLVSTGLRWPGGRQPVQLWDAASGQLVRTIPGRLLFSMAQFDGRSESILLANDYEVGNWHPTAPATESIRRFDDHQAEVWAVTFAPDGRTIVSGGDDHRIRFWDHTTDVRLGLIHGHDATVASIAWHPDGRTIATASLSERENLKLWDARTGHLIARLPGHVDRVRAVVFTPDGTTLASAGNDRTIRLWDGATGQPLGQLAGHTDVVRGLAFARDARCLTSVSNDGTVCVWDWKAHRLITRFNERYQVPAVAFAPDGATLATADEGGFIYLRDTMTWRTRRIIQSDDREIRALTFAPDSQTLAAGGVSRTIRFWDPTTGQPLMELADATSGQINSLAFAPDGKTLAAADHGGAVLIYHGPQP